MTRSELWEAVPDRPAQDLWIEDGTGPAPPNLRWAAFWGRHKGGDRRLGNIAGLLVFHDPFVTPKEWSGPADLTLSLRHPINIDAILRPSPGEPARVYPPPAGQCRRPSAPEQSTDECVSAMAARVLDLEPTVRVIVRPILLVRRQSEQCNRAREKSANAIRSCPRWIPRCLVLGAHD